MAAGPTPDKVCPFRLSRIAEFPTGGVMSVGKEIACFGDKCELWQSHAALSTAAEAQGCSLRLGTVAAIATSRE
jgi:hypothetical protein